MQSHITVGYLKTLIFLDLYLIFLFVLFLSSFLSQLYHLSVSCKDKMLKSYLIVLLNKWEIKVSPIIGLMHRGCMQWWCFNTVAMYMCTMVFNDACCTCTMCTIRGPLIRPTYVFVIFKSLFKSVVSQNMTFNCPFICANSC